jgi:hypothetical protein
MARDITMATTAEERDIITPSRTAGEASGAPRIAVPTTEGEVAVEVPTTEGATDEALRPSSYAFVPPDVWALARGIAAVLGETLPPPPPPHHPHRGPPVSAGVQVAHGRF